MNLSLKLKSTNFHMALNKDVFKAEINQFSYGYKQGWLVMMEVAAISDFKKLMTFTFDQTSLNLVEILRL